MAKQIILTHPSNGEIKKAPLGFSWTSLFFNVFPALFRGDFRSTIRGLIVGSITGGAYYLVLPFVYNKIFLLRLFSKGYKISGASAGLDVKSHLLNSAISYEFEKPVAEEPLNWFYAINKQRQGPFRKSDIKSFVKAGTLGNNDLVWTEGYEKWMKVFEIPELLLPDQPKESPTTAVNHAKQLSKFLNKVEFGSFGLFILLFVCFSIGGKYVDYRERKAASHSVEIHEHASAEAEEPNIEIAGGDDVSGDPEASDEGLDYDATVQEEDVVSEEGYPAGEEMEEYAAVDTTADDGAMSDAAEERKIEPGFDCGMASNETERMICSDPALADLDVLLLDLYRQARNRASDKNKLKEDQVAWVKISRLCHDKECLEYAYRMRILQLGDNNSKGIVRTQRLH